MDRNKLVSLLVAPALITSVSCHSEETNSGSEEQQSYNCNGTGTPGLGSNNPPLHDVCPDNDKPNTPDNPGGNTTKSSGGISGGVGVAGGLVGLGTLVFLTLKKETQELPKLLTPKQKGKAAPGAAKGGAKREKLTCKVVNTDVIYAPKMYSQAQVDAEQAKVQHNLQDALVNEAIQNALGYTGLGQQGVQFVQKDNTIRDANGKILSHDSFRKIGQTQWLSQNRVPTVSLVTVCLHDGEPLSVTVEDRNGYPAQPINNKDRFKKTVQQRNYGGDVK